MSGIDLLGLRGVQGQVARFRGVSRDRNPYPPEMTSPENPYRVREGEAWTRGWDAADEHLRGYEPRQDGE